MRRYTEDELRQRIELSRDGGERLYDRDHLGRLWLADYAADNDVLGDALEQLLDRAGEPIASRWHLRRAGMLVDSVGGVR